MRLLFSRHPARVPPPEPEPLVPVTGETWKPEGVAIHQRYRASDVRPKRRLDDNHA